MRTLGKLLFGAVLGAMLHHGASADIITVNTADNTDFGVGKTNLWLAITVANTNGQSANTIQFNIPGAGPHHLVTPQLSTNSLAGGYPIITNHNLTIDGYSQPGALPNTNTILGRNTAVLKIVIDSREAHYATDPRVGATTMDYSLITGKTYGNSTDGYAGFEFIDAAQIGIFDATNITIKGLCFLNDFAPIDDGLGVASIALGADYPTNLCVVEHFRHFYPDYNLHVAGCWFNLMPDGTTVVDGGYNAVRVQRHRAESNNSYTRGRWSPSAVTIGVAQNSLNPRAEFNIIMSQVQGTALQGERNRYCGNFFNVLADGIHQYFPDPQRYPGDPLTSYVPTTAFIGGCYAGYGVIGTDGDGVNDVEERNVFAGLPRKRSNACAQIDHQSGSYHVKVAGNYIGVAVDGVTRWTNSTSAFRFSNRPDTPTNCVFGSEFDGVSDDLEANVICNNWPLDYWFEYPEFEPDLMLYYAHQLSPRYQPGAPPEVMNWDSIVGAFDYSFRGNKLVNNFTAPHSPFSASRDRSSEPWYFPSYTNVIASSPFTAPNGTAEEGATNFVTVLDPSSSTRRLRGTFPLGIDPRTNVIVDVYVANEEGLVNGAKFQTLTNILPVWAQGETTLAYNFEADAAADLNPLPGAFIFDISPYNIPAGTKVTVTASYAQAGELGKYMAAMHTSRFSLPVTLNAASSISITSIVDNGDGTGTITWTGGDTPYVVEESTDLGSGVWTPVALVDTPTITGPIGQAAAFYRIR
ncbi:MAG: hypothetical protein JXQ71_00970 [Verrucomicrobia bacterium]|nr:hypothetical protein [Verrucomicrobiota bacterium]